MKNITLYSSSFKILKILNEIYTITKVYSEINENQIKRFCGKNNIEFRRGNAGGGNQLRQPYLSEKIKKFNKKNFQNVEHVHFFGYYIGNYPSLSKQKIKRLCEILNTIKI